MEKGVWEERIGMHAHQKTMGLCNRVKRRVCAKKRKSILVVKGRKGGSAGICRKSTAKRIYLTIKITTDIASPLHG